MKRASALKYGSKYNSVISCSCTSAYRSRKSVMMIQFTTSKKHVKFTKSNVYNTRARFSIRSEV